MLQATLQIRLISFLKSEENFSVYSLFADVIDGIERCIGLSEYLEKETKQW